MILSYRICTPEQETENRIAFSASACMAYHLRVSSYPPRVISSHVEPTLCHLLHFPLTTQADALHPDQISEFHGYGGALLHATAISWVCTG